MISNYFNFIKESHDSSKSPIYWSDYLNKFINNEWIELNTRQYVGDIYYLCFKVGNDQYDYYSVLYDKANDQCLMDSSERFIQKFKTEFWKEPAKYIESMKKCKPKFLGDLSHVEQSTKYNL